MDSEDDKKDNAKDADKNKSETKIEKVGGIRGWLLRKVKTFVWDAKSNTLVLPQGVSLTVEEEAELRAMFGEIVSHAKTFEDHRRQMMQQVGIKFKNGLVEGYKLRVKGTYRELTGALAHKIHDNLQGILLVNNRFVKGLWSILSKSNDNSKSKVFNKFFRKGNDGR